MTNTKTPWEIGIKDHKGRGIIFGFNRIPVLIYDPQTKDEDVQLIVRAVNNHELLINQLLNCKAYLKANYPNDNTAQLLVKAAEQAIAKAEAQND